MSSQICDKKGRLCYYRTHMLERENQLQEMLGDKFQELANAMPDAPSFLLGKELEPHTEVNFNIRTRTLTFITERSEWGQSGGIARFSRVGVWQDGQVQEREFQYRDRWSADRDNYGNDFKSADIESVTKEEDDVIVRVSAKPFRAGYNPRPIEFRFSKASQTVIIPDLSEEEQGQFEAFFKGEMDRVMREKLRLREFTPKRAYISPHLPVWHDPTGLIPYEQPSIVSEAMDKRAGLGAFITREQIDHDVSDPQLRYELYVAKYGQEEAQRMIEDHAYLFREGDPSIMGLEITGSKVAFTTRTGRKEINTGHKNGGIKTL